MGKHEYKQIESYFSFKRGARKVQRLEDEGWELLNVFPILFVLLGGGVIGYSFVMKRQLTERTKS